MKSSGQDSLPFLLLFDHLSPPKIFYMNSIARDIFFFSAFFRLQRMFYSNEANVKSRKLLNLVAGHLGYRKCSYHCFYLEKSLSLPSRNNSNFFPLRYLTPEMGTSQVSREIPIILIEKSVHYLSLLNEQININKKNS